MKSFAHQERIVAEAVRNIFIYDSVTGLLYWRYPRKGRQLERPAGVVNGKPPEHGYRTVCIDSIRYLCHRLVWAYVYGVFPYGEIDHINGDRGDNRIENLRIATRRLQNINRSEHRNGKLYGAYKQNKSNRWRAICRTGGKRVVIGNYDTEQEAHDAYVKWCQEHGI